MAREVISWNVQGHAHLSDEIIDPFDGQGDLKKGVLRHVSAAFDEDPLRVLRVARFCSRFNFEVHPSTMRLMCDLVREGEVSHLVPERVWIEFEKALMEEHPCNFFRILDECDALNLIMPEI